MLRALRRAKSAIRRHSFNELIPLAVVNLRHAWKSIQSSPGAGRSEFDERFSLETEQIVEVGSLDAESPNARFAVRYQPSPPELVKNILSRLNIRYEEFTFIDFGAGKGRVLLIGSEFGFAKVIGIEFSPELVRVARTNLVKYDGPMRRAAEVEVVLSDVIAFRIPEGSLVCYFYNPFQRPIMSAIASRLHESMNTQRREIYVYVQPEYRDLFDMSDAWTCYIDDPLFVVYRSRI